jgi:hypothetical protein
LKEVGKTLKNLPSLYIKPGLSMDDAEATDVRGWYSVEYKNIKYKVDELVEIGGLTFNSRNERKYVSKMFRPHGFLKPSKMVKTPFSYGIHGTRKV